MQQLGTLANQSAPTGFVGLISYTALVYAFVADLFVFQETFTLLEVLGVFVVAFFMFLVVCRNIYNKNKSKSSELEMKTLQK
jgi:drug/metabolite transporter (DMT)-like permease